jgi:hypothetical protein
VLRANAVLEHVFFEDEHGVQVRNQLLFSGLVLVEVQCEFLAVRAGFDGKKRLELVEYHLRLVLSAHTDNGFDVLFVVGAQLKLLVGQAVCRFDHQCRSNTNHEVIDSHVEPVN